LVPLLSLILLNEEIDPQHSPAAAWVVRYQRSVSELFKGFANALAMGLALTVRQYPQIVCTRFCEAM